MRRSILLIIALAVLMAGCGGEPATTAEPGTTEPASSEPAAGDAAVAVGSTSLGDVLVDGEGKTLYLFMPDEQGESTCYDECEQTWPPLAGPATASDGADESLLSTTERTDGTMQVTYNGWPLYYYTADAAAGDVKGQGVGEVWFVVDAQGNAVEQMPEQPAGGRDY